MDLVVLHCCHKHILASRARQTPQPANRVMLVLVPVPSCQPCKRGGQGLRAGHSSSKPKSGREWAGSS